MTKTEMKEKLMTVFDLLSEINDSVKAGDVDIEKGREALATANTLKEQFNPYADDNEEMVVNLLNDKFNYDGKDYAAELLDAGIVDYADDGMIDYLITTVSRFSQEIEQFVSDTVSQSFF